MATSPQPKVALAVIGATLAAFVVLRLVAWLIAVAARRAPASRFVELRMALAALHRPGALTPSVVLSLGLGLAALVALSLIDLNMRAQLKRFEPGETPSFFFLDVRGRDAAAFTDFLKTQAPEAKLSEVPMMRGRFVKIGDVPAEKVKARDDVAWALQGDRGVTFADKPPEGSEVVAGEWWPADYSGPPLVSMEKDVAEGLGLKLGDTVVVNVLGRDISARIASLRKVNWRSYAINFVLVYSPNTFKGAPYSELVTAALPAPAGREGGRAPARDGARLPDVASVRVREVLETVEALIAKLALAIRAATGVALTTSVLVLASALAASRRARLGDATILQDSWRDAPAALCDVPDGICVSRRGDRRLRRRGRDARRLALGEAAHAGGFRLRMGNGARGRRRRPRGDDRARDDRRVAGAGAEACGFPAGIVIGGVCRVIARSEHPGQSATALDRASP